MGNKKKKRSEIDDVKWELRKRGVRPKGSLLTMAKKLEEIKQQEELEKAKMNNNANKNKVPAEGKATHSTSSTSKATTSKNKTAKASPVRAPKVVLWRDPFKTIYYFLHELNWMYQRLKEKFLRSNRFLFYGPSPLRSSENISKSLLLPVFSLLIYFIIKSEGIVWYLYWIFLGVLSSVGLGSGLHTFLLYLGPFIAKVALAAQECMTLDFPTPPYPNEVVCPEGIEGNSLSPVSFLQIVEKVRWECLMWGFGTALGELPPYFMAKAARLSGMNDDEEMEEFNQLLERKNRDPSSIGFLDRGKLWVEEVVEKVGFFGILACASIPNPLFDLAGITCGHFLVPFFTFFGATVIGKAVIKVHLQMAFVILAFNEELMEWVVGQLGSMKNIGPLLSESFMALMKSYKDKMHNRPHGGPEEGNIISYCLDRIIVVLVIYFIVSIVNAMAQNYQKRLLKTHPKKKVIISTYSLKCI